MVRRTALIRAKSRSGSATVEFALVLPAILFLFVAVVDFARIFRHDLLLSHAARTGALFESDPRIFDNSSWTSASEAALAVSTGIKPAPAITVTYGSDSINSQYVQVTAAAPFRSITRFPGLPAQLPIARTVRMQKRAHYVDGT